MDEHLLGVGREVEELVDQVAVLREARRLAGDALGEGGVLAAVRVAAEAHIAVAAEDRQAADDVIARLDVGHFLADLLNDAGGLVAEDGGRREHPQTLDEVQVGVADAAGDGADEYLAAAGLIDVDVVDLEWLAGAVEDGGFHGGSLVVSCWLLVGWVLVAD